MSYKSPQDQALIRQAVKLVDLSKKLVGDTDPLLDTTAKSGDGSQQAFELMATVFLPEQINYLRAINTLCADGPPKAIGVLARTMVEGMIQLRWAEQDSKRAERWRAYAAVHDYRLMLSLEQDGQVIDAERKKRVQEIIANHSKYFIISKRKRKQVSVKSELEKSRSFDWKRRDLAPAWYHPLKIRDLFEQIGEGGAYVLYEDESNTTHWDIGTFARYHDQTVNGFSYRIAANPKDTGRALIMGIISLIQTVRIATATLNLNAEEIAEDANEELNQIVAL